MQVLKTLTPDSYLKCYLLCVILDNNFMLDVLRELRGRDLEQVPNSPIDILWGKLALTDNSGWKQNYATNRKIPVDHFYISHNSIRLRGTCFHIQNPYETSLFVDELDILCLCARNPPRRTVPCKMQKWVTVKFCAGNNAFVCRLSYFSHSFRWFN